MVHLMTNVNTADLKQLVSKIESLESEKSEISEHIRDTFAEAKHKGYDIKVLKQVIKLRKKNKEKLAHEEAILETYRLALGI